MNIGIIGGGAIGLLVGAHLAEADHEVTIYVRRNSQKKLINHNGITILHRKVIYRVQAMMINEITEHDLIIVCVKQYQLANLLPMLTEMNASFIFMQNGMGHVDNLLQSKWKSNIMVAITDHGAIKISDYTVNHTGIGRVRLALISGSKVFLEDTHKQLNTSHFPVEMKDDWYRMLASKLVINAVINPVTALFQVKNGEIISNPYLFKLCKQLCEEACFALGLDNQVQWERVIAVAKGTQHNDSSMKVDVMKKRKTEIDGILGYLLSHRKTEIPFIKFAYNSVKSLEYQYMGEREDD